MDNKLTSKIVDACSAVLSFVMILITKVSITTSLGSETSNPLYKGYFEFIRDAKKASMYGFSRVDSASLMVVTFIFLASLFTALGFFDKLVNKFKCGLLIPITGFAHSMTSAFMDYRKEGFVYGFGSNAFKLAGTVIVYGVLSAWIFGMVRFFIGG